VRWLRCRLGHGWTVRWWEGLVGQREGRHGGGWKNRAIRGRRGHKDHLSRVRGTILMYILNHIQVQEVGALLRFSFVDLALRPIKNITF
jgi:hypothetical protein